MKFMSNAGVFIVIAAFAAYAAGEVNMPEESSIVVQDSADDEQTGASLRLRLRRCDARLCEIGGCQTRDECDNRGNCVRVRWCRMKREDFDVLDAAMGVYEDEMSKQMGSLRARRSLNADAVEEAEAAEELRLRLRRCVFTVGRDSNGNQAEQIVCRMKREDFAVLDAAMGVYEDALPAGDNVESADDEQTADPSGLRQRRTVYTHGCDNKGNCGIQIVGRMKREDSAIDNVESADDEQTDASSGLRQRRCVTTYGCDSQGNCGLQKVCRMKREDSAIDNVESADDEQTDAPSELRQRRTVYTHGCDSQGNCGIQIVGRMKREDSNVESADDEQTDASSGLRQRRCVTTYGCDSRGNCGLQKVC